MSFDKFANMVNVDALEVLTTVSTVSGMQFEEILRFVLSSYDFDGQCELSVDEVSLSLKSLCVGLCKISGMTIPKDDAVEILVNTLFKDMIGDNNTDYARIQIDGLIRALAAHPDVISWFNFFSSPKLHAPTIKCDPPDGTVSFPLYTNDLRDNALWKIRSGDEHSEMAQQWRRVAADMTPAEYANSSPDGRAPKTRLELSWVYGYEGQRGANNVHYDCSGHAMYPSGRYVITYDFDSRQQRIFGGHTDVILCVAMAPDGQHVASGEGDLGSQLLVWEASSHSLKFRSSYHRHGVSLATFSRNGKFLASVGDGSVKQLLVSDWRSGERVYSSFVGLSVCRSVTFTEGESVAVGGDGFLFVWRYFIMNNNAIELTFS